MSWLNKIVADQNTTCKLKYHVVINLIIITKSIHISELNKNNLQMDKNKQKKNGQLSIGVSVIF